MEGNESEQGVLTMTGVASLIRPELRRLLWAYRIPPASMADLLERALLAAVETWDEGADKEDWLLKAVELECCAYWRGRRRRAAARRPAARPLGGGRGCSLAANRDLAQAMRRLRAGRSARSPGRFARHDGRMPEPRRR